jgi:hypothetical protein
LGGLVNTQLVLMFLQTIALVIIALVLVVRRLP